MKITIHTDNPQVLFNTIKTNIDSNTLKTWEYRNDNNNILFYHDTKSGQWNTPLYLKAIIDNDRLLLILAIADEKGDMNIIDFENNAGYLIGRFIQILLVHFKDYFSHIYLNK